MTAPTLVQAELTLPAAALRDALRICAPFTDPDAYSSGVQDLDAVCLDVRDGRLVARATNRYAFVEYRVPASEVKADFGGKRLLVVHPAAKTCLQLIGGPTKNGQASITVEGDTVRMAVPGMQWFLPRPPSRGIVVDTWIDEGAGFVAKLASPAKPVAEIGISPELAAKFGAVARILGEYQSHWSFAGQRNPVTIRIGERFTAWLMPIRQYPPNGATS
jgi:hypothetical protein